jgi:hypothetical protein
LCLAVWLNGCATLVNGSHQTVEVTADPAADVTVDGERKGVAQPGSPLVLELSRRYPHDFQAAQDGYVPLQWHDTRKTSVWGWANFLWVPGIAAGAVMARQGGYWESVDASTVLVGSFAFAVVGVAVDAWTKAAFYYQSHWNVKLKPKATTP